MFPFAKTSSKINTDWLVSLTFNLNKTNKQELSIIHQVWNISQPFTSLSSACLFHTSYGLNEEKVFLFFPQCREESQDQNRANSKSLLAISLPKLQYSPAHTHVFYSHDFSKVCHGYAALWFLGLRSFGCSSAGLRMSTTRLWKRRLW